MENSKNVKKYYTYLVQCSDGSLYCGYTVDINKRLTAHNKGQGAKYTLHRRPVKLVYYEEFEDKSSAMRREAVIKKMSRQQKLSLCAMKKGSQ